MRRLLDLAEAVPEKKGARKDTVETPFLERLGNTESATALLRRNPDFLGECTLTFGGLFRMKAGFVRLIFFC